MGKAARAIPFPAVVNDEDLLDYEAAASRIGVRPETLKKMAQRGEIPSVKYGKLRRFEPQALREYVAKHRVG